MPQSDSAFNSTFWNFLWQMEYLDIKDTSVDRFTNIDADVDEQDTSSSVR